MSMSANLSSKRTLWQFLTEPHSAVRREEDKQRARVLAVVSLALVLVGLPIAVMGTLNVGSSGWPMWLITVLWIISYVLSRSPRPQVGAGLLVFGLAALDLGALVAMGDAAGAARTVMFMLMPILLSLLLMPARVTVGLAVVVVAVLLGMSFFIPWFSIRQLAIPMAVIVLMSLLASAAAVLRDRDIETIRRQAADLSRYSQSLQAEVDQRTRNILVISEIGQAITGARDLEALLKRVVNLIIERFGFYHAQVFLIDEEGRYAVLKASTGQAGQELLARGHKLEVGSRSVIGQVTSRGEVVIASDTDTDPIHRRNELLPHTRSEMALPLQVGGRIIGALDIQSVTPNAFTEADIPAFRSMADQLAIAIENARLFERAQRDLQDIELLNRQLTGEAWRKYVSGRSGAAPVGYEANERGVRPILPDAGTVDAAGGDGTLSLPLTVRGETIGVIDLTPRSGEEPDEETRTILQAVAERVALALDSTRLSEQARSQAEREQILSRLSAELQATTDLHIILKIAAREASRALGTPRGFVHLQVEYGPKEQEEKT
jgi:GAF domain-containing protein